MKEQGRNKNLLVSAVALGVLAGVVTGWFLAHRMMGDMAGIKGMDMEMKRTQVMEGMGTKTPGPKGTVAIPATTRQLIGVRSTPALHGTLQQEIRTVGTVDYDERRLTRVNLKVSGWVRDVFVNSIGQPVRRGEPLFTLYSPDLLATQDEYLLAIKLQAQLVASPLTEARANAEALVASARERLHLWDLTDGQINALERRRKAEPVLTVFAPSTGIVLKREAIPGMYVEPGTTLYEVVDLSTVWIFADIYESEVAAVALNQAAVVTIAAYPGDAFHGKVSYIYPTLNAEARAVRIRLELPNPGVRLKPGMYGTVTIRTEAVRTLLVPKEAVMETGLRQLLFVDRGAGTYEPRPVKVGRRGQDSVEIVDGLNEGERVVISANFLLDAEAKLASSSSMQAMMGRVGMADWQMRGAHEGKMEGMQSQEMKDMKGMK